ncbi:Plasmodium exported protein, unknown function [Plasmodium vivax]|uniref:Fam-l protein n=1 Tax=Plasmodium vivax TaxID=5855 RepID=A0A565A1B0_PLAVI|nr:Plasmodium exported protein, unknown function [Plasmodium vivax]
MAILRNVCFNKKVKSLFIIKIITFLILALAKYNCHDEHVIDKSFKNEKRLHITLDIRSQRFLAGHENKYKLKRTTLQYRGSDYGENYNKVNDKKYNREYTNLKVDRSNNLEAYKKSYNTRYAKKKGLEKLDCYYENKVFDKFGKIEELAKKINNKKALKRLIYKKYGLKLILIFLLPLLGLIVPIYLGVLDGHFSFNCKKTTCMRVTKKGKGSVTKIDHGACGKLEFA